jgi:GT2 family glycosyltransferase
MSQSVYILIPVHNRKAVTLTCLETLQRNGDLAQYQVVVIDDGSTDGTAEAIQSQFPQVIILKGDGNLWWTGAIVKGMEYAYKEGADFFIWLNDDTLPLPNAISTLVDTCTRRQKTIATAQCYSSKDKKTPTYGGQVRGKWSLKPIFVPENHYQFCDCTSGNLVCLPRSVVDQIGYPPSQSLPQCFADVVYTWKAKKKGYQPEVIGNAKAFCEFNELERNWLTSSNPILKQWRRIKTKKSNLYPPAYWHYCTKFYDFLSPLVFVHIYIKLILITLIRWLVPKSFIKRQKRMNKDH